MKDKLQHSLMSAVDIIKAPISEELKAFEPFFRKLMKSKTPLLNIITNYIVKRKGKQMRPMLVFLSAKLLGKINNSTFNAASLIEFMHTATLIHDDVVDDSHFRRGVFSINALWKNKIAVLVGDYLLSKGLLLAVDNKEYKHLQTLSTTVKEMSEGELLQIEKARKLDITEEVYYDIIRKKTAVLIAACSSIGAKSVDANDETVNKMWEFGELVGMAFQIKDDIFDFDKNNKTGKPAGNDIKEKKLTLPLIYVLNNASLADKRRIIKIVKNKTSDNKKIEEVVDFVVKNGGIEYSKQKMIEFKDKAMDILNTFPDNDARKSLNAFVDYTIFRTK